jgi:hypothetical protein
MLRRWIGVLVVLGILTAGVTAAAEAKPRKQNPRLHSFRSCTNLLTYARSNGVRVVRDSLGGASGRLPLPPPSPVSDGGGQDEAAGDGGGAGGGGGGGRGSAPTSQTNVQEAGVDEPDRLKAARGVLYVAAGDRLQILDAASSPPRVLGSLKLPGFDQQLLLHGSRLLVIAPLGFSGGDVPIPIAAQVGDVPVPQWLGRTRLLEVDVADPAAPSVLRTLDVEGSYVNARLTGETARVVVQTDPRGLELPDVRRATTVGQLRRRWRRSVRRTRAASWLPSSVVRNRRTGRKQRRALVRCRQVRRTKTFTGLGTITVLTLDMSGSRPMFPAADADALMASGETVYASQGRLYVASERWLGSDPTRAEVLDEAATGLHAFDTTKPHQTAYVGSGEVPGYLLSQWSLSEHEGVLRAATTSMPPWQSRARSESAVRTLTERAGRLVEIGRVGGLGRGERIYAVRFMGPIGFVVTFRQVDPLYTLDLADPRAPKVVGELKVPGYSAYLHPLGDGLLLGIGQDATETGMTTGVQLSLFDVSDLRNPVRLAQRGLGLGSYSDVENDHHAFLWWGPERLAVIPVYRYGEDSEFAGAMSFRVDRAGGIVEAARFDHPGRANIEYSRSVVVGDRLLLVSGEGVLSTSLAAPGVGDFVAF